MSKNTLKSNFLIGLIGLISCSIISPSLAHNGPEALTPKYEVTTYPVKVNKVNLPYACQLQAFSYLFTCHRSMQTELALEKEFWAYIQNINTNGMRNLVGRINSYVKRSNTQYKGRLIRLMAFGNVMVSQETPGISLDKIPTLLTAKVLGEKSNFYQGNNVNALSLNGFTDSLINYALKLRKQGDKVAEGLISLNNDEHGEYGLEAEIVGAMAYTYTTDKNRIEKGLSILNNCEDYNCIRTTALAPFKEVGVMVTIAEGLVALDRFDEAQDILSKALNFSEKNNMPMALLTQLKQANNEILNGNYANESIKLKGIGAYRLPAGPSQSSVACALCHSGAQVSDHFYSWKNY
jgi:hypothetical protein